jgi:hypothetical protein
VLLESEYGVKDKIMKNTGGKVVKVMIRGHIPFRVTYLHKKIQIAVTQTVHTPTTH